LLYLLLTMAAQPALAETVHSLDQVPARLKTPEAKHTFAQQIEGKPAPDGLGVHLPPQLSAPQITALLVPADDKVPPSIVGARPLPGQPSVYAAIVCTGGNMPGSSDDKRCDQSNFGIPRPDMHVYLGVIEAKENESPHLIAKPAAIDGLVNWHDTNLSDAPTALEDANSDQIPPDTFDSFDMAAYTIAPNQRAFGLRGEWSEGYAGGGANYIALYLFAVIDGTLKQILAVPMSFSKDIAGDWHADGTRDHDLTEGANVLVVLKHSTSGHFDLLLKARDGKSHRLLKWSEASNNYQPAGK
jgi:hypothetical protein